VKRTSIIIAILALAVITAAFVMNRRGSDAPIAAPGPEQPASAAPNKAPAAPGTRAIGVDELMKNVDKHRGSVVVEGIVSAAAQGRISLIDCGELEKCGVTTCARLTLPVQWSGTPPAVKQRVRLHGQVRESDGKLVFAAETLEGVEPQGEKGP
jgi:hypothetical protein